MFKGKLFIALALMLVLFPIRAFGETAATDRISGGDRYETSIEISKKGWASSSQYAILARGDKFADALCAGPLGKKYDAPILLTQTDRLNPGVLSELKRLKVKTVFIVGGPTALSANVENALISEEIMVRRIAGKDRYETSVKIGQELGESKIVALATGADYPDALSISAPAAKLGIPILLTEKSRLPEPVKKYIYGHQIDKTYIIGGRGAVGDIVLDMVPEGERLSGTNRYETNVRVLEKFEESLNFNQVYLAVADGPKKNEFADALSGSVLAAKTSSPVILAFKELSSAVENFVKPRMTEASKVFALGGEKAVSNKVLSDMADLDELGVYINVINPPSSVRVGESAAVEVKTFPGNASLSAVSSNRGVAEVKVDKNIVTVKGMGSGTSVITVTAKAQGMSDGVYNFVISRPVYNVSKDEYYDSIGEAVAKSSPGNTIKISPGLYREHITITKNNLKLIGAGRDEVVIDASQDGRYTRAGIKLKGVSGVEIKNLTIKNAGVNVTKESGREPYGILLQNSDKNLLENLKLQGNGDYEIYLYDGSDLNTVQNCSIDGKGAKKDYHSLDGIFSSGGESGRSSMNTGNKFINNSISNVVVGISLTASENTKVLDNTINSSDSSGWLYSVSAGIVLSNSSYSTLEGNSIEGARYGIRLSFLSGLSPYAYAGTPDYNRIKENSISYTDNGIRVMGNGNTLEDNYVKGNAGGEGIWLADTAKTTAVKGNILSDNEVAILVDNPSNEVHYNMIVNSSIGVKNNSSYFFNAVHNYWGEINPETLVRGNVDYSPWLGGVYDLYPGVPGFQVSSPVTWCTDDSIYEAVSLAKSGDTVRLKGGTYTINSPLIIDKDISIEGSESEDTIIKTGYDGDTSEEAGAITVKSGRRVNLSDLTIDGSGARVKFGISTAGKVTIDNVRVRNINYEGQWSVGMLVHESGEANISNSQIENVGGSGMMVKLGKALLINNSLRGSAEGIRTWTGASVNGQVITVENPELAAKAIEGVTTFSDDIPKWVLIYDASGDELLYPLPAVPVEEIPIEDQ